MRSVQFNGTFGHKVDAKGRMSIAAEFRDKLRKREAVCSEDPECAGSFDGGGQDICRLVLTKGLGTRHIWCFPIDVWDRKVAKINMLPNTEKAQDLRRHLIGGAHECEIDRLGRILISPALREYAGISAGDVVVTGMGETFEIWPKEEFGRTVEKKDQEKLIQEYAAEFGI